MAPAKPGDKTFTELVNWLKNHFNPAPSEIVSRFKFNRRNRVSSEMVSQYVAELRKMAIHCNFGDTLDNMLRDRLVMGICNKDIQSRLLAEATLTLEQAMKISQAMESAEKNIKDLQSDFQLKMGETVVHKIKKKECYRCGGKHSPQVCRYKEERCFGCGLTGHIRSRCRKTRNFGQFRTQSAGSQMRQGKSDTTRFQANVVGEEDTSEQAYAMYNVSSFHAHMDP